MQSHTSLTINSYRITAECIGFQELHLDKSVMKTYTFAVPKTQMTLRFVTSCTESSELRPLS